MNGTAFRAPWYGVSCLTIRRFVKGGTMTRFLMEGDPLLDDGLPASWGSIGIPLHTLMHLVKHTFCLICSDLSDFSVSSDSFYNFLISFFYNFERSDQVKCPEGALPFLFFRAAASTPWGYWPNYTYCIVPLCRLVYYRWQFYREQDTLSTNLRYSVTVHFHAMQKSKLNFIFI